MFWFTPKPLSLKRSTTFTNLTRLKQRNPLQPQQHNFSKTWLKSWLKSLAIFFTFFLSFVILTVNLRFSFRILNICYCCVWCFFGPHSNISKLMISAIDDDRNADVLSWVSHNHCNHGQNRDHYSRLILNVIIANVIDCLEAVADARGGGP